VLQDVYAKVLSGRAVLREQSTFKTWLFGVIRLTAMEHRRWRFASPHEPGLDELRYLDDLAARTARAIALQVLEEAD